MNGGSRRNRLRENRISGNGFVAPGNNFGIGFIAAAVQENLVEQNTIVGNAHGIRLEAGTEKNVFRKNVVMGNPAVQMSVSLPAPQGYDIVNLSAEGANVFDGNVCLTGLNAPCPAVERSFAAFPNPIPVAAGAPRMTTISWNVPGLESVEVRVGKPDGALFASGGPRGSAKTGTWVNDGMMFFLQDVSGGKPLTRANTLATITIRFE
ncbi:MAG: hypothetical protein IANPNBLG_03603 [Bryobacteraceae bacterium]|nr:hypothetical protein [Bryobacteraceae bacterium]